MTKKKSKKKKDKRLDTFMIFVTISLGVFLIAWIVKDIIINNKNDSSELNATFKTISIKTAIDKMDEVGLTILYIGYNGCSACESFSTKLSNAANDYDLTVYYIDYKDIDKRSNEWKTFTNKLDLEVSVTIDKDGKEVTETKAIGEFLREKGYTPVLVIFDSGKMVGGSIGDITEDSLKTKLESAGFMKK